MIVKIKFLDYWHLSSGLSAGASGDSTVVKDEYGLPYIPAKTLKGLAREFAEHKKDKKFFNICFRNEGSNKSQIYFSNAYLEQDTRDKLKDSMLKSNLYDTVTSTKIDEKNGLAQGGSLREIEVVVPLTLYTKIENVPTEFKADLIECLQSIKRMGLNRNRGLGRCIVSIGENNE